MGALVEIILPVFLVMSLGYGAVLTGAFPAQSVALLMKFSQNFAIPLLLFRAISTLDLSHGFNPALLGSYYTGSVSVFVLGLLGARFIFSRPWTDSVAIGFSALFANSVLLGLPIMELAFGAQSLAPNYAIVSIHAPFCYFLGIATMEAVKGGKQGLRATIAAIVRAMFKNALMLAILAGFVANLSGLTLPGPVASAFDLMIRAALPTALFALGGILYQYRPEGDMREVLMICVLSLFVHPAIAFVLTTQVFALDISLVRSAVLTASMAPGVNSFIFASMFGVGQRVAASAVLAGTLLSILSVTFWLSVLGV